MLGQEFLPNNFCLKCLVNNLCNIPRPVEYIDLINRENYYFSPQAAAIFVWIMLLL